MSSRKRTGIKVEGRKESQVPNLPGRETAALPQGDRLPTRASNFVRELVRKEARNFYYGFLLLPPRKRKAIFALYAFCRLLDDTVDKACDANLTEDSIRERFALILQGASGLSEKDRLVALSLQCARSQFPIRRKHLEWIIEGVLMDLKLARYRTFADLRRYLFGVASSVGLACMEIFGYRARIARKYAVYLGYAMQLTNIIRDVREDYLRGRIYLPLEELDRFQVKEEDLSLIHI